MVVSGRIAFLRGLASRGAAMSVHISNHAKDGQCKVKVLVHSSANTVDPDSVGASSVMITLDWLLHCSEDFDTTDRGHKQSCGASECCFRLKRRHQAMAHTTTSDIVISPDVSTPTGFAEQSGDHTKTTPHTDSFDGHVAQPFVEDSIGNETNSPTVCPNAPVHEDWRALPHPVEALELVAQSMSALNDLRDSAEERIIERLLSLAEKTVQDLIGAHSKREIDYNDVLADALGGMVHQRLVSQARTEQEVMELSLSADFELRLGVRITNYVYELFRRFKEEQERDA